LGVQLNTLATNSPYVAALFVSCAPINGVAADFVAQSSERYQRNKVAIITPASGDATAAMMLPVDNRHNFRRTLAFFLYYQGAGRLVLYLQ
jgi:hypothetical protein